MFLDALHRVKFMPLMKAADSGAPFPILISNLSIPADLGTGASFLWADAQGHTDLRGPLIG